MLILKDLIWINELDHWAHVVIIFFKEDFKSNQNTKMQ